jgi:DNA mismatch endonuclease (patch repair protein)
MEKRRGDCFWHSPLDTLSQEERSERMSRVRGKNTKPELVVRGLVRAMGYGYRLHVRDLPGCPDLVFLGRKKVIFVHGCFWHRHEGCPMCRLPKTRLDFWVPKLEGNRQRDLENQVRLREQGWDTLIIWECQLRNKLTLAVRIKVFLEGPK